MRADLAALTPDSLAALTNVGLVKRAQKEIAAGQGPVLTESPEGTVSGRFPDGVVAMLEAGRALKDGSCTCGAPGACRHRVATALAYPTWIASEASAPPADPWWPAGIVDDVLQRAVGRKSWGRAEALVRRGLDAELVPGATPLARLPTSTVQFLVPGDLAYARCDCVAGAGCEHVAAAVWAFREGQGTGRTRVHLGGAARIQLAADPTADALALAREVLLEGVVNLPATFGARVAAVRQRLDGAGMVWLSTLVDDVEEMLAAYHERSARHSTLRVAQLLAEIAARVRAARGTGELPPRAVLGLGESPETPLGHARLVSLGCRLEADGRAREAQVFLADPEGGVVLVAHKRWTYAESEAPQDGAVLGGRALWPGARLRDLAQGQLVSNAARRRANRALRVSSARRGTTSITAQDGAWSALPEGIVVRDLDAWAADVRTRPPEFLRPRLLAAEVRVVEIGAVRDVVYAPGTQTLFAVLDDAAGRPLLLSRAHRAVAPHALESLAASLGATPMPRFVSGTLRLTPRGVEIDPVAVLGTELVVPDLAAGGRLDVALVDVPEAASMLGTTVQAAWSRLEEASHTGLRRVSAAWVSGSRGVALDLEAAGLPSVSRAVHALARQAEDLHRDAASDGAGAAASWETAAVHLQLAAETLAIPDTMVRGEA